MYHVAAVVSDFGERQGEVIGYNYHGIPRSYLDSTNITYLDIFRISVVSLGGLEAEFGGNADVELIETRVGDNYYQFIFLSGKTNRCSISNARDTGALLSLMAGKDCCGAHPT